MVESPSMDKHSSLLQSFVNYGRKKLYNIGPKGDSWVVELSFTDHEVVGSNPTNAYTRVSSYRTFSSVIY
jgi:hypothetical protein